MGGGTYSFTNSVNRRNTEYKHKSTHEIFTKRSVDSKMSPENVDFREARDSDNHPESLPIVIGLDVTGSMGSVPDNLIRDSLPKIVASLIQNGIDDPAILFLAIGDHECDESPLQVGQFESGDEELDMWLENTWLEKGGGGNEGESYLLAWYFAGYHTIADHFEKREDKGFLITIGDEPNLDSISRRKLTEIMGDAVAIRDKDSVSSVDLLEKAKENYHVHHINVMQTYRGRSDETQNNWKQTLGDHLHNVESHEDVAQRIAEIILSYRGHTKITQPETKKEEVIL